MHTPALKEGPFSAELSRLNGLRLEQPVARYAKPNACLEIWTAGARSFGGLCCECAQLLRARRLVS